MAQAVYIAAQYADRANARELRDQLERHEITVTSRWLDRSHSMWDEGVDDGEKRRYADEDLEDVRRADVFVEVDISPNGDSGHGGRDVEFGYALCLGKPLLLVGERRHVFHFLSKIHLISHDGHVATSLVAALKTLADRRGLKSGST